MRPTDTYKGDWLFEKFTIDKEFLVLFVCIRLSFGSRILSSLSLLVKVASLPHNIILQLSKIHELCLELHEFPSLRLDEKCQKKKFKLYKT
jgi:hypothetical protein